MQLFSRRMVALAAFGSLGVAGVAQAAFLPDGEYALKNHPASVVAPPPYGLRLDELYDVVPGDDGFNGDEVTPDPNHDIFTFNFEGPGSDMRLTVSGNTLHIHGVSYGGRDIGGTYAADQYLGLYTIDFTYSLGVSAVPGDDDRWVTGPNNANGGSIKTPLNDTFLLGDINSMDAVPYSFRLGDADDDLGYRGAPGISGWGWLSRGLNGPLTHVDYSDWLFLVGDRIPAPGSMALMGCAGLLVARRNRRA